MLLAIDVGNTNIAFGIYSPQMPASQQPAEQSLGNEAKQWAHH